MKSNLYKEHIMDLYKNPQNFGEIKNPTHKHTQTNSNCGDELTIELIVKKGKVEDIKFNGSGCVISLVSASLLSTKIKGMDVEDIKKMTKKDVLDLLKIKINPGRIKCVLLSLQGVQNAITN
jgi:nitrogen fixation protein NifU and related proteins